MWLQSRFFFFYLRFDQRYPAVRWRRMCGWVLSFGGTCLYGRPAYRRKHCTASAFRPFLTSQRPMPRASGETKSFAIWHLIVSALTEMGREAPQPAADTQLRQNTHTHTPKCTAPSSRWRQNHVFFFWFLSKQHKQQLGLFLLSENRH